MAITSKVSIKQKIIKGLRDSDHISIKEKTHPLYKAAYNVQNAILFHDITITKPQRQSAIGLQDIEHLPYSDFIVLMDMAIHDETGEVGNEKDAVMVRLWRNGEDIYSGFYYRAQGTKVSQYSYVLIGVYKFNPETKLFHDQGVLKFTNHKESFAAELEQNFNPQIMEAIYVLSNFQSIVKNDPTSTYAITSKVKVPDRPKYIEYTLDLSKPITRPSESKGGTHASPMEHTRRGHYRTSKLGKRYFVRDTVVNKGSKHGKVTKDYTM